MIGLPIKLGGMGIPSASFLSGATYLASCKQSDKLQAAILSRPEGFNLDKIASLTLEVSQMYYLSTPLTIDNVSGNHPQRNLLNIIALDKLEKLKDTLPNRELALLGSRIDSNAVAWLNLLCSKPLRQHIPAEQFRTAFKFQFGMRLIPNEEQCQACGRLMDVYGEHGTICHMGGGLTARHNAVRDKLCFIARESGYISSIERENVLDDGSEQRPADVYIHNWNLDIPLAVDCAVICGGRIGIQSKEREKRGKYLVACENNNVAFSPFVLDSHGIMGECARRILDKLAVGYAERHFIAISVAKERLRGMVMQAMIREQSVQIVERLG
jgi:hypothetical protein